MKKNFSLIVVLMVSVMSFGQDNIDGAYDGSGIIINLGEPSVSDPATVFVKIGDELSNIQLVWGLAGNTYNADSIIVSTEYTYAAAYSNYITKDLPFIIDNSYTVGNKYVVYVFVGNPAQLHYFIFEVVDATASADEYTFDRTDMVVYPSPATSSITVRFFADKTDIPLYIFSLNGETVFSDNSARLLGTENKIELDLTKFEKGTYLVKVGELVEKLIVE